mgnify:CR=1 FL=1|jgi:hypothetical protein|tara:strand:+ start:118 stop:237 length:120 start_codon:yes stop_codon:yes gene_type:complete
MSDDEFKDCEDGDEEQFQDPEETGPADANPYEEEQSKFI